MAVFLPSLVTWPLGCTECGSGVVGHYRMDFLALSWVIALVTSYVALDLGGRVGTASGLSRRLWLISGATMMGIGIWAMHLVGILALVMPVPVSYGLGWTLASMLVAIAASGGALAIVARRTVTWRQLVYGGVMAGTAVAAMHYTGMAAMRMQ